MAKTRQQKEDAIRNLATQIKDAKSAVFANFQGLKVSESEELRKICREQNVAYLATKKTLIKRALGDAGFDVNTKIFEGGIAAVFGADDEVAPAQIVANFAKNHDVVSIFGGILEGNFIDSAKVGALSKLPSKHELHAQLARTLNAPVSGFVNVLAGNIRGFINVLNAVKETRV